jgi:hypothetical protein
VGLLELRHQGAPFGRAVPPADGETRRRCGRRRQRAAQQPPAPPPAAEDAPTAAEPPWPAAGGGLQGQGRSKRLQASRDSCDQRPR